MVAIEYLADHPEYIPIVAHWHQAQWGYLDVDRTLEKRIEELQEHLERGRIPTTFAAIHRGVPVGCASLIAHDMDTRVLLTPWLASLYVIPQQRRQGIGGALVRRVVEEARALNVPTLYLFTEDREDFYARRGWSVLDRLTYRGSPVVLMTLNP